MDAILRSSVFGATIMGSLVNVSLTVRASYETTMDFSLFGTAYSFNITKWSRRGFSEFASLFFQYKTRDPQEFGTLVEEEDGRINFTMTPEQKINIVTKGAKDIMTCIDLICNKYQRSVLDYAVWYLDKHPHDAPYEKFIALYTCHCIVNTHFMAPYTIWDVVKLPAAQ